MHRAWGQQGKPVGLVTKKEQDQELAAVPAASRTVLVWSTVVPQKQQPNKGRVSGGDNFKNK